MKIITETSVLLAASIFCDQKGLSLVKHSFFETCNHFFECVIENSKVELVITRTIENETKNTLNKAVLDTIKETRFPNIKIKRKIMTLQYIITNICLDRLEKIVDEHSVRLPIEKKARERIREKLEPFLADIVEKTVRYVQPPLPSFVKDTELRGELTDAMLKSLPEKGKIYKGMPADRDLTIMCEAALIYQTSGSKEKVYVASLDKHFIPNPIQVGSFLSGYKHSLKDEVSTTVRDKLAEEFGFVGEDPLKILEILPEDT